MFKGFSMNRFRGVYLEWDLTDCPNERKSLNQEEALIGMGLKPKGRLCLVFVDYECVAPRFFAPIYREMALCARVSFAKIEGWYPLCMPVTRFIPMLGGRFAGFPKSVKDIKVQIENQIADCVLSDSNDFLKCRGDASESSIESTWPDFLTSPSVLIKKKRFYKAGFFHDESATVCSRKIICTIETSKNSRFASLLPPEAQGFSYEYSGKASLYRQRLA